MLPLPVARTVADLRLTVAGWRREGLAVGFVPTMGALHEGHVSLVRLALSRTDRVVASVFVNPTQFGPNEDLAAYPRDEAGDAARLAYAGCHLLFAPAVAEMYPPGAATVVTVSGVSEPLDGQARPGHFAGVATVVAKLLNQVRPDVAVFGEKDYQQLAVIRRMVRDLAMPVEVLGGPLVRDADGLALSSRNTYLSAAERARALSLHRALRRMRAVAAETDDVDVILTEGRACLDVDRLDYLEVCDGDDLRPLTRLRPSARAFVAGLVGRTRLIDNLGLAASP